MRAVFVFKLFNSIKEEHEVDFAELELLSLFGRVERVRNFYDILDETPLKYFTDDDVRIQDILTHELPYGRYHGFVGFKDDLNDIPKLVRRLAYTREILVACPCEDPERFLSNVFPQGVLGKNVVYYVGKEGYVLFRFITNQYFLEKSQYISKVSRNEKEIDRNVETLFSYMTNPNFLYRYPATETMSVGKRLEDYFTIREEPSLYLTHAIHPYKGKFHPKMVRALLNYVAPRDDVLVMDNFAGSGTLLVEATLMGLDNIGVEINPLSVLMSNVKCFAFGLDLNMLKESISRFLKELDVTVERYKAYRMKVSSLDYFSSRYKEAKVDFKQVVNERNLLPPKVLKMFKDVETVDKAIIAKHILYKLEFDGLVEKFILLGISAAISDAARRTKKDFMEILSKRLMDMYLRVYLFKKLNEVLKIDLGRSITLVGDTRDMKNKCSTFDGEPFPVDDEIIDGIVNSPPYSTALDYIRNDLPQLTILKLTPSLDDLEKDMIGNPNLKVYTNNLYYEIIGEKQDFKILPNVAKFLIRKLLNANRRGEALRTYKFFKDMYQSLLEMHRVLKKGAKAAIIIGNNHYKIDGEYIEIKNDEVLLEMALTIGFEKDLAITRQLEKTSTGLIRYETVLIITKK